MATREILALVSRCFAPKNALIAFQNPESGRLEIEASVGLPPDADPRFAPGQGVPGWVAWHAKPAAGRRFPSRPPEPAHAEGDPQRDGGADPAARRTGPGRGRARARRGRPGSEARPRPPGQAGGAAALVLQPPLGAAPPPGKGPPAGDPDHDGPGPGGQARAAGALRHAHPRRARHDAGQGLRVLHLSTRPRRACASPPTGAPRRRCTPEGDLPVRLCLSASAVRTRKAVSFADIQSPEFHDLQDLPRDPELRSVIATPHALRGRGDGRAGRLHGPEDGLRQ